MKTILKSAFAASLMAGGLVATPVLAQAVGGTLVPGLAEADLDGAMAGTNAYKTAQQQRAVTYKAQIDQAEARGKQLNAQIQPLADKFYRDRAAPNANQATLQQEYAQIQQIQQSGQQELHQILQPVNLSEAYVQEQIADKLDQAVKTAMAAKRVSLLLNPQAILARNTAYDLTPDITAQLNTLIPSATLVPPAGWEPREVREARAQQQGQAPAPSGPQPSGR